MDRWRLNARVGGLKLPGPKWRPLIYCHFLTAGSWGAVVRCVKKSCGQLVATLLCPFAHKVCPLSVPLQIKRLAPCQHPPTAPLPQMTH